MNDSILTTIKKLFGPEEDDVSFNTDIIIHINSALMNLNQLGVGPEGFYITDDTKTWSNFLGADKSLEAVKTYIYLKVKMVFDPPTSPTVLEAMERQITQLEWRLNSQAERVIVEGGV
jgi:hypothetical protein